MRIAFVIDNIVAEIFNEATTPDYLNDHEYVVVGNEVQRGWIKVGNSFEAPQPAPAIIVESFGRIITVLAYRLRFTQAERVALKLVANGAGTEAAGVAVSMGDIMAAGYINLDHPATVSGTNALESATLIGVGRATEILSPPVYSGELLAQTRVQYGLPEIPTTSELTYNSGKGYSPEQYTLLLAGQL